MTRPLTALALSACVAFAWQDPTPAPDVTSEIVETAAGERILVHELELDAPIAEVWAAYTTSEGWRGWVTPVAEVDLRVGGVIRTNYDPNAKLGDAGTNTLHIVNYVPERVLTLKAELTPNWPEVMKQDADRLTNVILFDPLPGDRTRVESYGIGYGDSPEYEDLLQFFLKGNEQSLKLLRAFVEKD